MTRSTPAPPAAPPVARAWLSAENSRLSLTYSKEKSDAWSARTAGKTKPFFRYAYYDAVLMFTWVNSGVGPVEIQARTFAFENDDWQGDFTDSDIIMDQRYRLSGFRKPLGSLLEGRERVEILKFGVVVSEDRRPQLESRFRGSKALVQVHVDAPYSDLFKHGRLARTYPVRWCSQYVPGGDVPTPCPWGPSPDRSVLFDLRRPIPQPSARPTRTSPSSLQP